MSNRKNKNTKHKSRFWRIVGITAGVLMTIVAAGVVYLYISIKSITIEEIEARRQSIETVEAADEAPLPGILEGAVDKAEGLSNKAIDRQDALDAAAILLNSGLSFQEMYYLLGQSDEELSTAEKQRIRDLLLEKLTPEEISALRSITKEYGKGLLILDPNYPIELIGVEDKKERERIQQELEKSGRLHSAQKDKPGQGDVSEKTTKPSGNSAKVEEKDKKKTTAAPSADKVNDDPALKSSYEKQLSSIQSTCTTAAKELMNNAVQEVSQVDSKSTASALDVLQGKLLVEIAASEQRCDSSFQTLVAHAQGDGLSEETIADWKKRYNGEKEKLRQQAFSQIQKSLK